MSIRCSLRTKPRRLEGAPETTASAMEQQSAELVRGLDSVGAAGSRCRDGKRHPPILGAAIPSYRVNRVLFARSPDWP